MPAAPNGWWYELISQKTADGFVQFEAHIWLTQKARDAAEPPFILNNWKAQIRETHMRIVKGVNGRPLWQPDKLVAAVEISDFAQFERTQQIKYKSETVASKVEWEAQDGKKIAPFVFPTYSGVDEPLDPQFVRETFLLPLGGQIERLIFEYIARAEADGRSGDLRGTTLNLAVGAGNSDANDASDATDFSRTNAYLRAHSDTVNPYGFGCYFTGATVTQAATIDSAVFKYWPTLSGAMNSTIYAENVDTSVDFLSTQAIWSRARTTANASWVATLTVDVQATAPSLVSPIQEEVNRAGFGSSTITVLVLGKTNNSSICYADSYDGNSAHGATLDIDYSVSTTTNPVYPRIVRQAIQRAAVR